ncbi:MAG: GTP-binding protein [Candidatus Micrarchaeaceae archaeon]
MLVNRVTLLGHKDHGKSTLMGNLLIATNSVTEERIRDAKRISEKLGRKFEPGYILDSFEEEREGEMTIDTTRAQIKYRDAAFELIDVPGHEELISNMMSGASYASFALLLVSAKPDEGIKDQTKRHLFLAKMMGIRKILVAVNKMDTVGYSKERFESIRQELLAFLGKIGFGSQSLGFIPISAYNSDNLAKASGKMKWYSGSSLLDEMYRMTRHGGKAVQGRKLRISLQGALPQSSGKAIIGKVICGTVKANDAVRIVPGDSEYMVKSLFVKGAKAKKAAANENVAIELSREIKEDVRGSVLCGKAEKLQANDEFDALVFFVSEPMGNEAIRFNGIEIPASLEIKSCIDTTSGSAEKRTEIKPLNAANVRLSLGKEIAAEPFSRTMELGRFVLYSNREFAGIGIIK